MKSLKKIVVGSLVVALVSFAGSFCLHGVAVWAASHDMVMDVSQNASGTNASGCITEANGEISNTVNACISDCVIKAPQAVVSKKTSVDSGFSVVAIASQAKQLQSPELFSDPFDVTGTPPPSLDILSSVVKRE